MANSLEAELTVNLSAGLLLPIPTLPLLLMRMASVPPSLNAMVSAAGDHMPVLVSPVNVYEGVPTAPKPFATLVALAAPRVGVTNVGLVDSTTATLPVDDVTPVPPLDTARAVPSVMDEALTARPAVMSAADTFTVVPL
jgi:hypothetical protein